MKSKTICLIAATLLIAITLRSQQPIPADADAFYRKVMVSINPKHATWIKRAVTTIKNQNTDEAGIRKLASEYAGQYNWNNADIEALVILVMMQATKDNDQDLKDMMAEMKKINAEKQKLREAQEKMKENSAMTRQRLDSFRLLAKTEVKTVSSTQTTRLQTSPSSTQINKPVNSQVTSAEIKEVQDRLKSKLEGINEMSEMTSLRLQMMMDRRSKFISTVSNIMKKISETQDAIIQNLK